MCKINHQFATQLTHLSWNCWLVFKGTGTKPQSWSLQIIVGEWFGFFVDSNFQLSSLVLLHFESVPLALYFNDTMICSLFALMKLFLLRTVLMCLESLASLTCWTGFYQNSREQAIGVVLLFFFFVFILIFIVNYSCCCCYYYHYYGHLLISQFAWSIA